MAIVISRRANFSEVSGLYLRIQITAGTQGLLTREYTFISIETFSCTYDVKST
jgi:hypothetical protein